MLDSQQVLQDVAPRLMSDANLESALLVSLDSLRKYFPVDFVDLSYHVAGSGYGHRLCTIDQTGVTRDTFIELVGESHEVRNHGDVLILEEAFRNRRELLPKTCIIEGNSCLMLHCRITDSITGTLSVKTYREAMYSDYHKSLLRALVTPVSLILTNALKERNVLALNWKALGEHRPSGVCPKKSEIIGAEGGLKPTVKQAERIALFASTVLIVGETGVGKDVFACFMHELSDRRSGPFVKMNCGTIPDSLIDNELFGHEKGAFTGAGDTVKGRFEVAHRGTLFLDEVGELPLQSQVKLLRVLQTGEFERLGNSKSVRVDVRVIAATNRNLEEMVRQGTFREDLFWRLNVIPLRIPPVRERRDDIPDLMYGLLRRVCKRLNVDIAPKIGENVMARLCAYDWPGNVREMENVIEREVILHGSASLRFDDIVSGSRRMSGIIEEMDDITDLDDVVRRHILKVLEQTRGRISGKKGAASLLDVHPNTLRHKMKKLGIM